MKKSEIYFILTMLSFLITAFGGSFLIVNGVDNPNIILTILLIGVVSCLVFWWKTLHSIEKEKNK